MLLENEAQDVVVLRPDVPWRKADIKSGFGMW